MRANEKHKNKKGFTTCKERNENITTAGQQRASIAKKAQSTMMRKRDLCFKKYNENQKEGRAASTSGAHWGTHSPL